MHLAKVSTCASSARLERAAATRAEQRGRADQRAGLVDVHELELGHGQRLAHGFEVDRLAARPCRASPPRPRGASPSRAAPPGRRRGGTRRAAERRGSAARRPPAARWPRRIRRGRSGLPAPQHVVVHARQIVVHQRIGVDQLDRRAGDARRAPGPRCATRPPQTRAAAARACRRRARRSASLRAAAAGPIVGAGSTFCSTASMRLAGARGPSAGNQCECSSSRSSLLNSWSTLSSRIFTCCCASCSAAWQNLRSSAPRL